MSEKRQVEIKEQYEYTFPAYALSALINDDYSGLEEHDEKNLNEFLKREHYVDDWDIKRNDDGEPENYGDTYFSSCPEFGLAWDCVDVVGIVFERENS